MRKYVIWLSENDTKVYIRISDGIPSAVPDKLDASVMANRVVASSIVAAIRPAIKKNAMNVQIGIEAV